LTKYSWTDISEMRAAMFALEEAGPRSRQEPVADSLEMPRERRRG